MKRICLFLIGMLCALLHSSADTEPRIRIFFNCLSEPCHTTFLRSELSFFDVVRDRFQADVQVVLFRQDNGGGGTHCTVRFVGQRAFAGTTDSAALDFPPATTEVQERRMLLGVIERGMAPYVMRTPWRNALSFSYPQRPSDSLTPASDPWRAWIVQLSTSMGLEGESNRSVISTSSSFAPYRITARSKFIFDSWYESNRTRFMLDSTTVTVKVRDYGLNSYYAHTLSQHWSAAVFTSVYGSQYANILLQHRVAPAIEYNVYPFSENTRRQLRFAYQAGYRHFRYIDTTVYNRIEETRPYHRFSVVAAYAQPWGTISSVLQYHGYLDQGLRQYRLTASANMALRLFEGFQMRLNGSTSLVNDQISLAKVEASQEQLLLRGAQLPTRFLYNLNVGFSYTFGSTNNSVVNPRFENTD